MQRLLIPIISWNVIYAAIDIYVRINKNETMGSLGDEFLKYAQIRDTHYMWFFVPLITLYLSMPFIATFVLNSSRKLLKQFLVMSLILGCIPPLFQKDFTVGQSIWDVYLFGSRFLPLMVAGYYWGNFDVSKKTRHIIYMSAICSIIIMFVGTAYMDCYNPQNFHYFFHYTNLPCMMLSFGVFLLFKYSDWEMLLNKIHLSSSFFISLSSLSLGVYLIQALIMMFVFHFKWSIFIIYPLCLLSVWIIKKIPIVNRII